MWWSRILSFDSLSCQMAFLHPISKTRKPTLINKSKMGNPDDHYRSVLAKIILYIIIRKFIWQSTYKYLAMPCFRFLWIYFFVVDYMVASWHNFLNGFGIVEDNKRKSSWSSGIGICLYVNTFYFSICSKMVSKLP